MEYKLTKTFIALGTATTIFLGLNSLKNNLESQIKPKSETESQEEVVETFKISDLRVLDRKYASEIKVGTVNTLNERFYIMKDTHDLKYKKYETLDNTAVAYVDYSISAKDDLYYQVGASVSLMHKDLEGKCIGTEFLTLEGIYTLEDFLEANNLAYLIKDSYTKEELEELKKVITPLEEKPQTYLLEDLLIVNFANRAGLDNLLLTREGKTFETRALISILEKYYNLKIQEYIPYNIYNNSSKAFLITREDGEFLYIFKGTNPYSIETYYLGANEIIDSRSFLEENELNSLIKTSYTLEDLQELYTSLEPIFKEASYRRVLEK